MKDEIIVDDETIQEIIVDDKSNLYDLEYAFKRAYIQTLTRCCDCMFWRSYILNEKKNDNYETSTCVWFMMNTFADDFCSKAKRIEGNKNE